MFHYIMESIANANVYRLFLMKMETEPAYPILIS
jgi:hypothetical protein